MYTGKIPSLQLKKTNAEVIADAITFARWIVGDDRFGYGRKGGAKYKGTKEYDITHSGGCHFCGSNASKISKAKAAGLSNPEEWEYTYVCNTFVHACYAHAGVPSMMSSKGHAWWTKNYQGSKYWTKVKKPAKITDLKAGDVLGSESHYVLYIGNGKIAEATSCGDAASSKANWAKSIHITGGASFFKSVGYVFRFTGEINTTALIKYGEVSYRVKQWQAFLNWYNGKKVVAEDGIFGDATLKYTKTFQTVQRIAVDGIIGNGTLAKAAAAADPVTVDVPTEAEIRAASVHAIHYDMECKAKEFADGKYHYVIWVGSRTSTHTCPICAGRKFDNDFGWNCIGLTYAVWHHAGLPTKCSCGVIGNGTGEKMLKASDAEALKIAKKNIGCDDIQVIKNGGKAIPLSQLQKGDILMLFKDDGTYYHNIIYLGNGKYADSNRTGGVGSAKNIRTNRTMSATVKAHTKIAIRYTGTRSYLSRGAEGTAVKKIQAIVGVTADGIYGPNTEAAVKKYQAAHGLTADGKAGKATIAKMKEGVIK